MRPRFKDKYRVESIRLQNRDYAASGWYFVTICTYEKSCFFGNVIRDQMQLSAIGEIAEKFWLEIPKHSKDTSLNTYVIIPNHVHGIVIIDRSRCRDVACNVSTFRTDDSAGYDFYGEMSAMSPITGSLSAILRSYKAAVSRWCRMNGYPAFAWQPRFYDHIIRADGSLDRIREYIANNPVKWEDTRNQPENLWM